MSVKIMQLNAYHGHLHYPIAALIESEQPDLICMQEASTSPDARDLFFNFYEKLKTHFPHMPYSFHEPLLSFTVNNHAVHSGLLLMSRFPLHDYTVISLAKGHAFASEFALLDNCPFPVQFARVAAPRPFTIVNYHGYIDGKDSRDKSGTPLQETQVQQIINQATAMGGDVVFCTDLNLTPDSKPVALLKHHWRDVGGEHGITVSRPPFVPLPPHVCDYIFTSPTIHVKSFRVANAPHEICSDHLALFVEID